MPTQNFKVGEMLNKRTPNSKTWMNFDGSYTTEIHSGIVHYKDLNGNLQNIDTDLQDEADFDQIDFPVAKDGDSLFLAAQEKAVNDKKKNKLNRDNFDFQGLKVPFEAKLPRNIKRGYSIGKGASKLKFIPKDASPSKGYVDGNKITYQDVWNDADLILEVLPDGIKETIILKSERAPFNFSFEVQGELDRELKIQPPWLQDAAGTKRDVVQGVEEVDGKTLVNLAADVSGLVYPIEIDPTVTIQPDGTAGKDAYVRNLSATSNFNGSTIDVGTPTSTDEYEGLIQFDISSIPNGSAISSANLALTGYSSNSYALSLRFRPITSTWNEATVTWNTKPSRSMSPEVLHPFNSVSSGSVHDVEVKALVDYWLSGNTNYGIWIGSTAFADSAQKRFHSSESTTASYRPKLTVTYNQPPTAPTVTTPNGGESWNSLHTVEWSSGIDDNNTIEQTKQITTVTSETIIGYKFAGQIITIETDCYLKAISFRLQGGIAGASGTLSLRDAVVSGTRAGSTVYASQRFTNMTLAVYNLVLPVPIKFAKGTKLAIDFEFDSGYSGSFYGSTTDVYTGGNIYYGDARGSEYTNNGKDFYTSFTFDEDTPNSQMQHQIQLTTDNGATWKDIVSLTSAGATSYAYDFINEAESSTAKIRVRAYDGSAYGPWDESDGVFTIQHNQAPTAPTNLSPSSGTRDRGSVNRLSWQHNDANADPQAKFDLQWRLQGASTWNDVSQTTVNQYYDAQANLFPRGTIEWHVRTYDQAGLSSPYSSIATFFAGDKPAAPTIVEPGSSVAVANPTVQWSSVGQTGYKLTVKDLAGNTFINVERNSTNKAETITYNLANQTDYDIELSIKNADGLYSDPATLRINVSYTPPAIPDMETVKGQGFIQINIADPVPSGTQPSVTSHNVYKEIEGEFVLIATGVTSEFKDYQVASNQLTRYFVRTFGGNGTFSDTITFTESISFKGVWVHIVDEPSTLHQFKYDGDGRGSSWSLENAVHHFAGRRNPVMEIGVMEDYAVNFSLQILNEAERSALERIVYSGETVCYRDGRGRKAFGVFVDVPLNDERALTYSTSLTLIKIDFKEAIE